MPNSSRTKYSESVTSNFPGDFKFPLQIIPRRCIHLFELLFQSYLLTSARIRQRHYFPQSGVVTHCSSPATSVSTESQLSVIRTIYSSVASLPALGPWAPPAEWGPSLESIYRVSLRPTVDLCEG